MIMLSELDTYESMFKFDVSELENVRGGLFSIKISKIRVENVDQQITAGPSSLTIGSLRGDVYVSGLDRSPWM